MLYRILFIFLLLISNSFADKLEISFYAPTKNYGNFNVTIALIDTSRDIATQSYSLSSSQIGVGALSFDVNFSRLNEFVLHIERSSDTLKIQHVNTAATNAFRKSSKLSKYLSNNLYNKAMQNTCKLIAAFGTNSLYTRVTDSPHLINDVYYKTLPVSKDSKLYKNFGEESYTNNPIAVHDVTQALHGETLEKTIDLLKLGFKMDVIKKYAEKWHNRHNTYFDEDLNESYVITEKHKLLTKNSVVKIEVRIDQEGKFVAPQYQDHVVIRQIYIQTDDNITACIGSPDFLMH